MFQDMESGDSIMITAQLPSFLPSSIPSSIPPSLLSRHLLYALPSVIYSVLYSVFYFSSLPPYHSSSILSYFSPFIPSSLLSSVLPFIPPSTPSSLLSPIPSSIQPSILTTTPSSIQFCYIPSYCLFCPLLSISSSIPCSHSSTFHSCFFFPLQFICFVSVAGNTYNIGGDEMYNRVG